MGRARFRILGSRWAIGLHTALLAGCGIVPEEWDPLGQGFARKQVTPKREPSDLLAADQTRCSVDQERFASVKVGDRV